MYQSVLTNNKYTKEKICALYTTKLNELADKVVSNHKYGTKHKIDKVLFIKIKNLIKILGNINDRRTLLLNRFVSIITS